MISGNDKAGFSGGLDCLAQGTRTGGTVPGGASTIGAMDTPTPPLPSPAPTVALPDGTRWPALGLGTWQYGERATQREAEVAVLRLAFEIGYRLIDTAEMYGEGGAETVVGRALQGALRAGDVKRDEVLLVSKVYPHNASRAAMRRACEASRKRLGVDRIDLYLLHWRGSVPLAETVAGFGELLERGWIARWGVSNFDVADLRELEGLPGGRACAANQVYLSLSERGPEFELLPWQRERCMPLMAYSPIDQGALVGHAALAQVARRHRATPAQVALAALMAQDGVMVIPKSRDASRLRENWASRALRLTTEDTVELDRAFPPPTHKRPLSMR
jgi:diketogulonate reductase-like aldo/keto reductase